MKKKRSVYIAALAITGVLLLINLGRVLWVVFASRQAASIGIIGGADGPTAIYVSTRFDPFEVFIGAAAVVGIIIAAVLVIRAKKK